MTAGPAVYRAEWVIPMAGPPLRDGAVRVGADGRIERVGRASEIPTEGAAATDLGRAVIVPGLINVHAHPELTLLRGRLDRLAFPDWIARLIDYKYRRLDEEALRVSTELGVAEAIAAGVTAIAAPDDAGHLQDTLERAGMRGRVYREAFGPEPDRAAAALEELRARVDRMRARSTDLVEVGISPHAPYTVSPRLFRELAAYARAEALPVCIHAAESSAEDDLIRHGRGAFAERLAERGIPIPEPARSPIAWLARVGALAVEPLLVHCVRADAEDVAQIRDSGARVAHCPVSNARFGHGIAPVLELLAAGVPVGLGSDSVASNDRMDLLDEARAAILLQRVRRSDGSALSAEEALRLATEGAARALGWEGRIGTLEPGREADLAAVRLDGPHAVPATDPVATLVYSARGADVCLTMVRGRILFRDGEYTTLDWPRLARAAAAASERTGFEESERADEERTG